MIEMKIEDFNIDHILEKLKLVQDLTITVVGDFSLDKYAYSEPKRDELSVETGLIAYQVHETAKYAGIGGTVTNNLRSIGVKVICVSLIGDDGEGFELIRELNRVGADTEWMVVSEKVQTNTYLKLMRGTNRLDSVERNRLDFRNFKPTPRELEDAVIGNLRKAVAVSQGIIITDQFLERNCSVVTDKVRDEIARLALEYPSVFFFADSRGFVEDFRNVIQKCNEFESEKQREELKNNNHKNVRFVTMGEKGIEIYSEKGITIVPSFPVIPPLDLCGAGDAANAGIVTALALGLNYEEAGLLGACIASITIQQIGVTGVAKMEEIRDRLTGKI